MHTHHCLFTPALASPCRPLYPKDPREAVQKTGASVIMLCNHRLAHLHAANKPGIPIACCPTSILFRCIFCVCCCRLSQRCCLRGLWQRAPPSRSRLPSLTPRALQTLTTAPSSWNSGVQLCATVSTHFGMSSCHLSTRLCHWVLMPAPFELESGCAAGPMHSCHNVTVNRETSETNTV